MKKVFTLISFLVFGLSYSNGQVRITEVKPVEGSSPTFLEFYFKGSASLQNYKLVTYVNTGSQKIITTATFANTDYFNSSTNDATASSHTRGALVFSKASIGSSTFSRLYSELSTVNRYIVSNNNIGTAAAITDKDPFNINPSTANNANDVSASDKVAIFLFNGTTLIDFVTNISASNAATEFAPIQGLGLSLNVQVTPEKFINVGLSGTKSYQLYSANSASCIYAWQIQNDEDPGIVTNLSSNTATWEQDYYFWTAPSSVGGTNASDFSLFNEGTGAVQTNGSFLPNGRFEFFLYVINPTQFSNPSNPGLDLKLSIFAETETSGAGIGVFSSTDFYLSQYPSTGYQFVEADKSTIYVNINSVSTAVTAYKVSLVRNDIKIGISDDYYPIYLKLFYNNGVNCFQPSLQVMDIPYALPVTLAQFKVSESDTKNNLAWSTSTEQNNKGFEIQRSIGSTNNFKTIGFVGTKAKQGNSQTEISYSFEDADIKAGEMHYYRLNQIDFDGKSALSPVKSIKPGSIASGMSVYPNPSRGSVTVNTGSTAKMNMMLIDNTGRMVQQYNNVSGSNTKINNLKKGFYTIKIVDPLTGEQSAQRIVVQ